MMNEQTLENRLTTGKSSKDAISWLKTALDPFHDFDIGINGIPDSDTQFSVVQIFPKVVSVTAPPNLAANETWSCHIATLPLGQTISVRSYDQSNGYNTIKTGYDNGEGGELGTFTIITHGDDPTGQDNTSYPVPPATSYGSDSREFRAVSMDDVGEMSMKKIIAGGFEVHNDTADLYKQGSVTVYQNAQQTYDNGVGDWRLLSASTAYLNSTKACRSPPPSREDAAALPSSRTWEASKGVYVPIRLAPDTNYQPGTSHQFVTRDSDQLITARDVAGYMQTHVSTSSTYADWKLGHRGAAIETTGAYFSGLSPETVLTVTTKLIIESAPTNANPSLLFSATPTPDYDPKILALYYQTIRHLPPGVEVSFNAKGDWFRMVMKAANVGIPAILPFMSAVPHAALATRAALATGNAALAIMDKKKKKNKNSTSPPSTKAISRPNRA
jgi:hypothetical protein